jgi:citrate lyase subunit beta-like protein
VGSGLENDDLAAVLPAHPDGIVIPKVGGGQQVRRVSETISDFERRQGWPADEIALLALIESARGVVNLAEIATASPRLQAFIFGAEDLAGDIGAVRTRPGWEVFYARSATVTYAAAFGLQAMDQVFLDFHDEEGLRAECLQGVQMGYSGKQLIHPSQVAPAQEAFSPSDESITQALRVLEAAAQQQEAGKGAFALDGKMVDAPVVKIAQWVITKARAAGKISE